MRYRMIGAGLALATALTAVGFGAQSAMADSVLTATYPVSGETSIASTGSQLDLGPGSLAATVDLTTGQITAGALTLPDATGTFDELGFVPVTATVAFEQVGQVTGTVDHVTGATTATADVTLRITDLKVAGVDVGVGSGCQTTTPAVITVTSGSGFNVLAGGPVSGSYDIPTFEGCGLLGIESPVINAVIPGAGNTISLNLGAAALG